MNEYIVTRKDDGAEVYRYQSDAPVEWNGMEFATHDHMIAPVINSDGSIEGVFSKRRLTKLEFIDKMGDAAFVAILQLAKSSPEIEGWVEKMKLTTPDPDGASVMLDDERTQTGVIAIGAVLTQMGVVDGDWSTRVLA